MDGPGPGSADPFEQGLAAVAAAAAAGRRDVLFARAYADDAMGEEEAGGELLFSRTLRRIAGPGPNAGPIAGPIVGMEADGWRSGEAPCQQPGQAQAGQLYYHGLYGSTAQYF
jgi:hypothetical protein